MLSAERLSTSLTTCACSRTSLTPSITESRQRSLRYEQAVISAATNDTATADCGGDLQSEPLCSYLVSGRVICTFRVTLSPPGDTYRPPGHLIAPKKARDSAGRSRLEDHTSSSGGILHHFRPLSPTISKAGWSWGCISNVNFNAQTIFVVGTHRRRKTFGASYGGRNTDGAFLNLKESRANHCAFKTRNNLAQFSPCSFLNASHHRRAG